MERGNSQDAAPGENLPCNRQATPGGDHWHFRHEHVDTAGRVRFPVRALIRKTRPAYGLRLTQSSR
jgi:hypothetical protein